MIQSRSSLGFRLALPPTVDGINCFQLAISIGIEWISNALSLNMPFLPLINKGPAYPCWDSFLSRDTLLFPGSRIIRQEKEGSRPHALLSLLKRGRASC